MTRADIKDVVAIIQRHSQYPSRAKVHRVLVALYGKGISTNRLIPLLQQLRVELGITSRPNRPAVLRVPHMTLTPRRDSIPPRTDEAAHPTAWPAPDPTPDAARGNGEPPILPSHPEHWAHCGESSWGRFGQAERGWPAFASAWWECLGCHTVHPPPTPAGDPPPRVPPSRCERCRDIRFYPMADGRQQCIACGIRDASFVLARERQERGDLR